MPRELLTKDGGHVQGVLDPRVAEYQSLQLPLMHGCLYDGGHHT